MKRLLLPLLLGITIIVSGAAVGSASSSKETKIAFADVGIYCNDAGLPYKSLACGEDRKAVYSSDYVKPDGFHVNVTSGVISVNQWRNGRLIFHKNFTRYRLG